MSLASIHQRLRDAESADLPLLDVAVLSNVTIDLLEPYLRSEALDSGFWATVRFGKFDAILQQAIDCRDDLWSKPASVILVFATLDTLSPLLARRFPSLDAPEVDLEVERISQFVETVMRGLRSHTGALVLWHGFETPLHPALGIRDPQIEHGQSAVVRKLNDLLRQQLAAAESAYLIDMDRIIARTGGTEFYDRRYWHIARAPYGRRALAEMAREEMRFVRATRGKNRKCLVLDCDNTLWGGILGEDGLTSVQISPEYPGSTYREFQQEVLSLHERGVILALCSKNNEAEVWKVFHERPEMVLQQQHISAAQINWDDKVTNLRRIAHELNIGTDSLVLVDDEAFEIEMVREMLPEVATIHIPTARASEARDIIAGCGYFDTLTVSAEDRSRGEMYKAETERRRFRTAVHDLSMYLASLELNVTIQPVDEVSLPRAAQLTQRTNQFNLTTRRYSEGEIRGFQESTEDDVLLLRVADRFGEYGMVGAAILQHRDGDTHMDTFLMSCRVIGRGVEEALLSACLEVARRRSSRFLHGVYLPSGKNALVQDFLGNHGFELVNETDGERHYRRSVNQPIPTMPTHLKAVNMRFPEADG